MMNDHRGNARHPASGWATALGVALTALACAGCGANPQAGTLAYCENTYFGYWSATGKTSQPTTVEASLAAGVSLDGGAVDSSKDTLYAGFLLLFDGEAEVSSTGELSNGVGVVGGTPAFTFTGTFDLKSCSASGAYTSIDGTTTGLWNLAEIGVTDAGPP
jgi:hypothetical protein